jgi:retron-type reverse transcriptase
MADEKAELYRRLVQQTPDAVVLDQMRVHGFWGRDESLPADPPAESAERTRLEAERDQLLKTTAKVKNPEKLLAAERKRRWEESKQRRAEKKAERELAAEERSAAYDAHKETTVVHAGVGVSGGLQHDVTEVAILRSAGLPVLYSPADLAAALGIDIGKLRWLTYHRAGATLVHYRRYEIAKKTGGMRCISAPKPLLAAAQRWVLAHILARSAVEPVAHGFVPGHSVVSNAAPHVGKAVVVNLDLRDFFPSVNFRRVRKLFRRCGYSGQVASLLALLCTEPPRVAAQLGDKVYHVALGDRVLPQGACTSPFITNILCRRLDRRLTGLAKRHGYAYTRYADDLTFSGDNGAAVGRLLRSVRSIVTEEGFREHERKTKVMRRSRRQEVTGVVVNDRPKLTRKGLRELRAILHNAAVHGLESQNRGGRPDFAAYLKGRVEFACMVDPTRAESLRAALDRALSGPQ